MEQNKNFYELVLMIRPDASAKHIYDVSQAVQDVILGSGGAIEASEYWGFRTLAYRIEKRAKAHYVYFAFFGDNLNPLYDHLRFHGDIFRFLCLKEDRRSVTLPTPLLHSSLEDLQHAQSFQTRGDQA